MPYLSRRHLLTTSAAVLAAPSIVRAQAKDPIRIGNTMPLTGSQAGYGNDFVLGMRMAVKDVNDRGGSGRSSVPFESESKRPRQ